MPITSQSFTWPRKLAITLFVLCTLLFVRPTFAADPGKLVYVVGANGKPTALVAKVVVVSSKGTLSETPTAQGEPIEPWAIFFRVRNDDGTSGAVNGKLRVGDSGGRPVGWVAEKDVRAWSTRFILDPIDPQKDRAFELQITGGGSARQNAAPEGKRRYALISNPPKAEKGDDSEYPVVVYAGNVQGVGQGGTLAKQRNELRDVKLEIVFVIESTDFMVQPWTKMDPKRLFDYLKDTIRETLATLKSNDQLKGAVRLGFVEYQDNVPKAKFTSRTTCDLTDDYARFSASLDQLDAIRLDDDWPDDVVGGLNEAVQKVSWSQNSVKHIILLGIASCQLTPKGNNPNQYGGIENSLTKPKGPQGFGSTGLSIAQLIARARPQGGGESRARTSKSFHAFVFGKELEQLPQELVDFPRQIVNSSDSELESILERLSRTNIVGGDSDKVVEIGIALIRYQLQKHQWELAAAQYKQIAGNNGEADGLYLAVEPSSQKVTAAAQTLTTKIQESFKDLEGVRNGDGLPGGGQNELSQPLFTLVGAAVEKFKDSPVLEGIATVRDSRGREVAFKKVMVSEDELRHLKSTLDALYTKFKGKTSKVDRQDVGGILNDLKEILAETGAGQELAANVKLKDLISDLPLRTAALDTSPADLALMTTEAFKQWLDRLQSAVFRIEDLLTSRQDWLTLSEKAVNDKFTFLRISELP